MRRLYSVINLKKKSKVFTNSNCIKRFLHLHEYQSMELLKKYKLAIPKHGVATNLEEVKEIGKELAKQSHNKEFNLVIKAQVLTGGRGLGYFKENNFQGGVQECKNLDQLIDISEKMLGKTLITKQTGLEGKICKKVLIVEKIPILKEMYLAIALDRESASTCIIFCPEGGTSIEDKAKENPNNIHKICIDPKEGLTRDITNKISNILLGEYFGNIKDMKSDNFLNLNINKKNLKYFDKIFKMNEVEMLKNEMYEIVNKLYQLFRETDSTLIEVNPLVLKKNIPKLRDNDSIKNLLICDIKINIDDNASYRQKELFDIEDVEQKDQIEVEAAKYGLNYIRLNGNVGCIVNGAGLAMATMDIIKFYNAEPANFLDLGGTAQKEQVCKALEILHNDNNVKVIMVNVFAGIVRADVVAEGIIEAVETLNIKKPIVVRLQGTNIEQAKVLMDKKKDSINITFCTDLDSTAKKAISYI
ncbi:succinyl-CoA synthetase, beta subunit, putative [Cryptosporidium muris RN66]|uniref:Succinyl-CoA synthetase, beta subunit, putative n=1 Tax=Cryptosporidium muris (strain RN66) TaxID=441375 RepID=B6AFC2_CRYMR|nr:succinyl-CoA synthetase, beta subunit, putative [Cryptosporidium muris RN66]EEA06913.1 succinyl-CoA synthetase, beta subunit, putative [Cryptosporidium muris RN66]|eukprot:XP_002141262.1 succinyl-CoA synthetase, beta subunit [Cryptosporidium muris RN66]